MSKSDRIRALIEPLLSEGMSYQQIADRLGMTKGVVAGVCFRCGLQSKNPQGVGQNTGDIGRAARWSDPAQREKQREFMRRYNASRKREEALT